jgi:hypothetical protein
MIPEERSGVCCVVIKSIGASCTLKENVMIVNSASLSNMKQKPPALRKGNLPAPAIPQWGAAEILISDPENRSTAGLKAISYKLGLASVTRWLLAVVIVLGVCTSALAMEEKLKHFTLPNGLEVLVKEDHARKVAAIQCWVMVGSADEEDSERGISHLIEHMAFKGTERRGVGQIASEVEALGGETNAYTSWDETVFFITVPSHATLQGLDILTDAVLRPAIDAQELAREKEVVLEEILEGDERPERKASKQLLWTAYSRSPYRFPVIGYKETVEKVTRDDVLSFRKKWYVPENMFLLIVGDVNADQIRKRR